MKLSVSYLFSQKWMNNPLLQTHNQHLQWSVDHAQFLCYELTREKVRKVCLRSSSLVWAWGQQCHIDSQVSQPRLENQTHKQITGVQRERGERKEEGRRESGRDERRSFIPGWVIFPPHVVSCTKWRLQGRAETVRWEFPQACCMAEGRRRKVYAHKHLQILRFDCHSQHILYVNSTDI